MPIMSVTEVKKISGDFMSRRNIILQQYSIEVLVCFKCEYNSFSITLSSKKTLCAFCGQLWHDPGNTITVFCHVKQCNLADVYKLLHRNLVPPSTDYPVPST